MAAKPQRGMLVSFTQPDAEHEAEHNEWFNREHVDERVFTPGFTRSRRYEAIDAPFKYFATYETETAEVLSSDAYLKVVSNQSDWSKRVIPHLGKFHRMTTRVLVDRMHGIGGLAAAIRFYPPESKDAQGKLHSHFDTAMAALVKEPGMIGACLCENMLDAANRTGDAARAMGGALPRAERMEWLAVLEAADLATLKAATWRLFNQSALDALGVAPAPLAGFYRFVYGNHR